MYLLKPYDDALQEILDNGVSRTTQRTGSKTLSVFGMMRRYRLDTEFFPILTRRKVWPKSIWGELLWFISGSTSNKDLKNLGCNFWTPWVDKEFTDKHDYEEEVFGPVYGFQLRHFGGNYNKGIHWPASDMFLREYGNKGFDQLNWVIDRIKEDSSCRRTLWTLWNPQDVPKMRLPPCHMLSQILGDDDRRLSLIMYQGSCDFPVGVGCGNIPFYSAMAIMIAQQTDCVPHEFIHFTADSHIYEDQIEGVKQYLDTPIVDSPKLSIHKAPSITEYTLDSFVLTDFNSGPKIDLPVAV